MAQFVQLSKSLKMVPKSWGTKVEILFLNFSVGESVGVHHDTKN